MVYTKPYCKCNDALICFLRAAVASAECGRAMPTNAQECAELSATRITQRLIERIINSTELMSSLLRAQKKKTSILSRYKK